MECLSSISDMTQHSHDLRKDGKTIALVPTMGALHQGHLSLIDYAKSHADYCVVSIFVNPTQFGPQEDYRTYPRSMNDDLEKCRSHKVDCVFTPIQSDIYPNSQPTKISVPHLSTLHCGQSRPLLFDGVTSVLGRLFNIIQPNHAIFGEKDFQQVTIIKQMVSDLFYPICISMAPIVRDDDGLALSSRNQYLSISERQHAASIYKGLSQIKTLFINGELSAEALSTRFKSTIHSSISVEYLSIINPLSLNLVTHVSHGDRILFAGHLGATRLIDTLSFTSVR